MAFFSSQDSLSGTEGSFLSGPGNNRNTRAGQTISHESNNTVVDNDNLLIIQGSTSSAPIRPKSFSGPHSHNYVPCASGYSSLHYLTYQKSFKHTINQLDFNENPGTCLIPPLVEIASKSAAKCLPFEAVYYYSHVIKLLNSFCVVSTFFLFFIT